MDAEKLLQALRAYMRGEFSVRSGVSSLEVVLAIIKAESENQDNWLELFWHCLVNIPEKEQSLKFWQGMYMIASPDHLDLPEDEGVATALMALYFSPNAAEGRVINDDPCLSRAQADYYLAALYIRFGGEISPEWLGHFERLRENCCPLWLDLAIKVYVDDAEALKRAIFDNIGNLSRGAIRSRRLKMAEILPEDEVESLLSGFKEEPDDE